MSDAQRPPDQPSSHEREQAVSAWAQQSSAANTRATGKRGGLIIVAVAVAALGGLYLWQRPAADKTKSSDELHLAERAPVKQLPVTTKETLPSESSAPAAAASDPNEEERKRLELQQQEQARKMRDARLKSGILATGGGSTATATSTATTSEGGSLTSGTDSGAQDANSRYARQVSGQSIAVSKARQIEQLPYKILQGKIIDAVLAPRVISDLPGTLRATVQRDIVGTHGRIPLIPWGSTLIGQYRADLKKGQARIFPIWNRIIRPDGVDIVLDSPGADQLGTAGMGGDVDHHFAQIFGVSALLSIIGAGSSNMGVSSNNQDNSSAYYREQVQEAAANSAQKVLGSYADIPPTITVAPGTRVRIFVNRDLDFSGLYSDGGNARVQMVQ